MNFIEKTLNDFEDDFGPSSTVQESRPMFNDGGMLVQPSNDGSRPGYAKQKMAGFAPVSEAQQAGNLAKKQDRLSKIGELFINKDYKKLKVKTRKARMGKGSIDAGGVLNAQDKTMLNNIIYDGTVKEQNALAKELGINRRYMIEVYTESEKLKNEGKALQQSKAKLAQVQNQKLIFDEISNNKNATVESMAKKFKMTKKEITKESSKLLKNVYAQNVAIGKGPEFDINSRGQKTLKSWLPDNFETTDSFLDNFSNIKGLKNVQSENMSILIKNAYGNDPKKFTAAMKGLSEYNKLVNALPEGIKLDLDHPLSKSFLKGSGASAQELLYVTPISREYNRGFKQSLSMAYDKALLNPNRDKKLIKTIENFANTIGVNIGKGSTKKLDFGTTPITKKTQSGLASELVKNFKEQEMARKNLANFRKTKEGQNIIKQIFPSGRAQLNIPKVQSKGIAKKLADSGFECILSRKSGGTINCNDPRAYTQSIKENMARVQQGDNAAVAKVNKLGKAMNGFKGAAKFTGWGLLTELGFSAPLAAVDYAKGANKDEIISNATYGLFGKSEEEQLKEKYADYGQAQKFQDTYDKLLKQESALDDQTGYGPIVNSQNIKNTEKKLIEQSKPFNTILPPSMGFKGDFDLDMFFNAQALDQKRREEFAKEKEQRSKEIGILKPSTGLEAVELAGGGIAKEAGDRSGAMTRSMNPDSQGLSYLFNRVKKV